LKCVRAFKEVLRKGPLRRLLKDENIFYEKMTAYNTFQIFPAA